MQKEDKGRIRVTLNLDAKIYDLAKRMSKVEQKPISRIVDEALRPIVERYGFQTPEEWEEEYRHRDFAEMEEMSNFDPPDTESEADHEMEEAYDKIISAKTHEARLEALEGMKTLTESRQAKDEYRNRWIKYCSK